jgi:hypothetical protein
MDKLTPKEKVMRFTIPKVPTDKEVTKSARRRRRTLKPSTIESRKMKVSLQRRKQAEEEAKKRVTDEEMQRTRDRLASDWQKTKDTVCLSKK